MNHFRTRVWRSKGHILTTQFIVPQTPQYRQSFMSFTMKGKQVAAMHNLWYVAFEGKVDSFTYIAAKSLLGEKPKYCECSSVKDVFDHVCKRTADYGVIALENSSHGSIHSVYDSLLNHESGITIAAEIGQSEDHCFCIAKECVAIYQHCFEVFGHPVVLQCCGEFLDTIDAQRASKGLPDMIRTPTADSVDACVSARESTVVQENKFAAAIASEQAALSNNLAVAVKGIGNDRHAEVSLRLFICTTFNKLWYAIYIHSSTTTNCCTDSLRSDRANRRSRTIHPRPPPHCPRDTTVERQRPAWQPQGQPRPGPAQHSRRTLQDDQLLCFP